MDRSKMLYERAAKVIPGGVNSLVRAFREAAMKAAEHGLSFGASCCAEVEMAELVCEMVPSIEMVRI